MVEIRSIDDDSYEAIDRVINIALSDNAGSERHESVYANVTNQVGLSQ